MSYGSPGFRVVLIVVLLGGLLEPLSAGQRIPPPVGATARRSPANAGSGNTAVIVGQVLHANRTPYPFVRVRLRNLDSGAIAGRTAANHLGEFEFLLPTSGSYVAELVNETGHLLATGDVVVVEIGQTAGTMILLPASRPSLAGLFGNSAAAILSAAAGAGIAAVSATGQPVSPER